jgi:hypothetical protein
MGRHSMGSLLCEAMVIILCKGKVHVINCIVIISIACGMHKYKFRDLGT